GPRSDIEEDGLAVALQDDVEAIDARALLASLRQSQKRAPRGAVLDGAQHGIAVVGGAAIGEIEPRDEMLQETAGEYRHVDMRRLQRVAAARHRARAQRLEAIASFRIGRR